MRNESPVIVDSSALISLLSETDSLHGQAVDLLANLKDHHQLVIIPKEVFAETFNVLRPRLGNKEAAGLGRELLASPELSLVSTPHVVLQKTFAKLSEQTGNASYIDCLVMATADEYQTVEIFGFDVTFRKNGYVLPGVQESAS